MSGSWWLNVKRSQWGDNQRPPNSVALTIEHNEPALKYSGVVNGPGEDSPTEFEFNGAIDGKPYTAREDLSERTMTFTRKSDRVVESVSAIPGSRSEVRSTITMSADGRTLERRVLVREPGGKTSRWTEIYEKRQ